MMLYLRNDEQRSFPEYVDCEFKDIIYKPCESTDWVEGMDYPLSSWWEVLHSIKEGYYPDVEGVDVPEFIVEQDYNYSTRRLKKFCRDLFKVFGEEDKVKMLNDSFEEHMKTLIKYALENASIESDEVFIV